MLAGPTASGKTAAAIKIARHFNTEIISADSRQIYREMSIGTAVPSEDELRLVKHHFIHSISINQNYDVSSYEKSALELLDVLFKKHRLVLLTGGSGLFIDAVCHGLDNIPEISMEIRQKVQKQYVQGGIDSLQQVLSNLDPEYYQVVDKQNPRRLQRAIEVCFQTGKPFSFFRKRLAQPRDFETIWTALKLDRKELINRINLRVEKMMEDGLLAEVSSLYQWKDLNALNTVGYKELFGYLDGQYDLEEAVDRVKLNTRRYAKRQMTWFRKNKTYKWFHPDELEALIAYAESRVLD